MQEDFLPAARRLNEAEAALCVQDLTCPENLIAASEF